MNGVERDPGARDRALSFAHGTAPPDLQPASLNIGIWCDFGQTLLPHEGIGVFVHSLARGLLSLNEPISLTLVSHPGEQEVMNDLRMVAPDRVRVLPEIHWQAQFGRSRFWYIWKWIQCSAWLDRTKTNLRVRCQRALARPRLLTKDVLKALLKKGWTGLSLAAVAAAMAFVPVWCAFALATLALSAFRILFFPARVLDGVVRRLWMNPRLFATASYRELIQSARCDVWIIPYVGFEYELEFPSIVVIHDLVVFHFPELFEKRFVDRLREIVPLRAKEASICACMSDFIKENDLCGLLRLSRNKVRMIRPAAPADIPIMSKEESSLRKPTFLCRPYLFFPSAFRGYKNHQRLIEALHELRKTFGEDTFDLVFTGRLPEQLPLDLDHLARRLGVRNRIHVLGRVDRIILTALYREAFATIMPSLYEQGSFPVYEALVSECPVACSDIPSMREQCAAMGDSMLYFDPYDASAIARVVLAIRDDREGIRERQRAASSGIWKRSWQMVAAEWLPVIREAAQRPRSVGMDDSGNEPSPINLPSRRIA
jgi:glycosyltransferase involved in cell wall biosynthesis